MNESHSPILQSLGVFRMTDPDRGTVGYAYAQAASNGFLLVLWLLLPGYEPPPLRSIDIDEVGKEVPCRSVSDWLSLVGSWWKPGAVYAWSRGNVDPFQQIYFANHPVVIVAGGLDLGIVVGTALAQVPHADSKQVSPSLSPPPAAARFNRETWYLAEGLDKSSLKKIRLRRSDSVSSEADVHRWLSQRPHVAYQLDSYYYDSIPHGP